MQDLSRATGTAWALVAGIGRLGLELITHMYGTARMKQPFLMKEQESMNLEAIHALTGDLTISDPQAM